MMIVASLLSAVIMHDWNTRPHYHEVLQVSLHSLAIHRLDSLAPPSPQIFDIVESQLDSNQPGGGGMVILRAKVPKATMKKIPDWWW